MAQRYEKLVQEDLNVGTEAVWVAAPGGGQLRATQIGLHSVARGQVAYEATWAPGAIPAGSYESTTVTVPDAEVGDIVMASHGKMLTGALRISGHVSADETVTVIIHNPTAAAVTVASGTVRVLVFPYPGTVTPTDVSTVSGTVTYDAPGGPFVWVGINVVMTVDAVPWPGGDAITNGAGFYSFANVPAGAIDVSVSGMAPAVGQRDDTNSGVTVPPTTLTLDLYGIGI